MLEENASRLPYFLLSLRLLPISPNWAVNMCCGVLDVPITTFFLTVLIGLMPYNYICVTTGVILSKLTSINDIFTWTTMLQMSGVALMATLPAFLSKKQKKKPSPLPSKIEWILVILFDTQIFFTKIFQEEIKWCKLPST